MKKFPLTQYIGREGTDNQDLWSGAYLFVLSS